MILEEMLAFQTDDVSNRQQLSFLLTLTISIILKFF